MKLYCVLDWISQAPKYVLENPNIHGITIRLPAVNFMMPDSKDAQNNTIYHFNDAFLRQLNNDIKLIHSYGKEVALGIACGKFFPVYSDIRYITIRDSHHQGEGIPQPTRQPIFWDISYFLRFRKFIQWLAAGLDLDNIQQIKITGINTKFEECRADDQDYIYTSTTKEQAYRSAAVLWRDMVYHSDVVISTINAFTDLFTETFPGKILALPVLGTRNDFPCINGSEVCLPAQRPDIGKAAIKHGVASSPLFAAESTALDVSSGTPDKVVNSGAKFIIYQFARETVGDPTLPVATDQQKKDMQSAISNGHDHGADIIEVFRVNVLTYPEIHA